MKVRLISLGNWALLPVLASCAVSDAAGDPDATDLTAGPDPLVEAIVYTTLRPPSMDIHLFDAPGGTSQRLTDHPALDYNAVFSPDGRWVVFTSERAGNADLYALDLEAGGEPVALTRHEAMDDAATFSPDGARLAFVSTRDGHADIFVMPFAPGDPGADSRTVNLTRRPGGDFNPAFSPDGRSIAYSRQDELETIANGEPGVFGSAATDVYVMDADGSNPLRLSQPGVISGSPAWSADGGAIYYYRRLALGDVELRCVAPDGTGDAAIGASGLTPAVMPGGRIAFSQPQPRPGMDRVDILRTGRIFSVEPDGSGLRPESDTTRSYFAPDFDGGSSRMLAHGAGSVEGVTVFADPLFGLPDARRRVTFPDRTIEVRGIRGYFPAITPAGDVLSTIPPFGPTMPLHISGIDGEDLRPLFTRESGIAWGAAVARDANAIVVAVGPPFADGTARVDIWKLDLNGSNAVNLTDDVEANDAWPHVSADGRRIVFRSGGVHGGSIYVMDGDGGNRRQLGDPSAIETMPAISPDGEWVVFSTSRAKGRKLWIERVDGTEGRFLEPDRLDIPDLSMHARFSPDGKWVVFTSDRAGFNDEWALTWFAQTYGDLWAVPVAGGDAIRLTHNKWEDGPSDWGYVRIPGQN